MNQPLPSPQTTPGLLAYYTFDDLKNEQGNATWDGTLGGSAAINKNNPDCSFVADSCGKIVDVCASVGLKVSVNAVPPKCAGYNDGSVSLSATGNNSPFQYRINNAPFQNNSVFTGLSEGTYVVSIKDCKVCIKDNV